MLLGNSTFYPLSWGIIRVIGLITFIAPFDSYCDTLHTNFSEYCIIFRRDSDILYIYTSIKNVWRNQGGNQNQQIEEGQTTQRPKTKGQKDKQRSSKHYTEN